MRINSLRLSKILTWTEMGSLILQNLVDGILLEWNHTMAQEDRCWKQGLWPKRYLMQLQNKQRIRWLDRNWKWRVTQLLLGSTTLKIQEQPSRQIFGLVESHMLLREMHYKENIQPKNMMNYQNINIKLVILRFLLKLLVLMLLPSILKLWEKFIKKFQSQIFKDWILFVKQMETQFELEQSCLSLIRFQFQKFLKK